ncbi:DUF3012 domain-containing protein [Vibrio brasiliensis]|uniref:DUF3012 domain-containing protein n=1 Tax=Vibrio brasiliensis TaxID=170652 RepID=UPI001EFE4526|nr:DUF3012 domain-containing protein [Vibrio brasiliensis]MCG9750177.1 DUF3012 domain-containing protein [Vibrio brasiliensis]MCG9784246.1 DUF3012 domain-containing protein [Vibrio brasiliensis]
MKKVIFCFVALMSLTACQTEVGTQQWCDEMADKPKSEWNAQGAVDFAKHCVLQDAVGSEAWCNDLEDTPKGDWSANQATSYAKHCVF